jgi:hypothetical protein
MKIKLMKYYPNVPKLLQTPIQINKYWFLEDISFDDADGVLFLEPDDSFFSYGGPKAFYQPFPL